MSAPSPEPQPAPAAPTSRYAMGSAGNMVRSLVVILGMVAVLIAIVPRVQSIQQPPVDAPSVASDAVRQSGLPFEAPVGLPDGWSATNARYAPWTDGIASWQAGWSTPNKAYIAIRQAKTVSPAWIQSATSNGKQQGTTQLGGRTWALYVDSEHHRVSYVIVPTGSDAATQLATVVTTMDEGNDTTEVSTFVGALRPAQPR